MKIVDKRLKLFGIINIFDLFVLCAIGFLTLFCIKWTMIAEDPSFIKSETVHVKCKGITTVPGYMSDLIREGDTMLNGNGNVICRIEKVLSVVPATQVVYQSKDGEKIFSVSDQVSIAILFDLAVYKRKDGIYFENLGSSLTDIRQVTMKSKDYTITIAIMEIIDKP